MAYTLHDYSMVQVDPLKKGVIDIFRKESLLMERLPWETAGALSIEILRTKALPSVSWRKIGGNFSESKGTFEPISERVFDVGGYIDVDKLLVKAKSIIDQRAIQEKQFITAHALEFNDKFVNGNPVAHADTLTGIWYRLVTDLAAAQSISLSSLDISPDATTLSANLETFLDAMGTLIHRCDGHACDALLMNETVFLRIQSALRQKGLFTTTKDSYGRTIHTWGEGGPELIDVGYKADQSTKIITDVENASGAVLTGGACTSIYAIKWGQDEYLNGFEEYALDVQDIGLLESGIAYRTVIDWPLGMYMVNPRAIARLYGLVAA
jgi:hypothetical protein